MTHYRMTDPNNPPPRDGTLIDLWTGDGRVANATWNASRAQWEYTNPHGVVERSGDAAFTHWSPIVPPPAEPQESLPPEVEQDYQDFWKGIIEKDGSIDLRQLKLELSDYRTVMRGAAKVYDHVTGGQVSKPNTDPDVVCSLADDHYRKCHEDDEPQEPLPRCVYEILDNLRTAVTSFQGNMQKPRLQSDVDELNRIAGMINRAIGVVIGTVSNHKPQESLIRWHGPEVAATWPVGSTVLVDLTLDGTPFFEVFVIAVKSHIYSYPSDWRYALIKRGGE